jgi:hypothetical protein
LNFCCFEIQHCVALFFDSFKANSHRLLADFVTKVKLIHFEYAIPALHFITADFALRGVASLAIAATLLLGTSTGVTCT